jgi:AcrR family transcriptional regulator
MADALDTHRDRGDVAPAPETESTHERILDVAERLFARKGFAGTAVRDIAREAALTAPSLYNHFDGKQALYEAVLARGVQPLVDLIDAYGSADGSADGSAEATAEAKAAARDPRTGDFLDRIVDHLAAHPDIAKLIQHESLMGGASLSRIVHGWLRPIVSAGLGAMEKNRESVWSEEERPLAVAAWIHVIVGHFASAPLLEELFQVDPLSPEQLERQKRFLRRFAGIMMSSD